MAAIATALLAAPPAISQSPIAGIMQQVRDAQREIEEIESEAPELIRRRDANSRRQDIHDAKGVCKYPHGHPEACDWWIREANEIDAEKRTVNALIRGHNERLAAAHSHLSYALGRMRALSETYDCLRPFSDAVNRCANMDAMSAQSCLATLWAAHC
jgi:hypothetical protein